LKVELTNKKILVDGGAEFIDSNLCEELLRLGNQVSCLDDFLNGKN
jgi:UDP-N-acetylglucosamine 4-epimerase